MTNGKLSISQRNSSLKKNFRGRSSRHYAGIFLTVSPRETSQVLLAGVSGGFPGVLPFRPPIDWLVSMSEIILKGTLN